MASDIPGHGFGQFDPIHASREDSARIARAFATRIKAFGVDALKIGAAWHAHGRRGAGFDPREHGIARVEAWKLAAEGGKGFADRGHRILKALDDVSAQLGSTPAQVSLAWLMAQPSIAAPIASATSVEQLHDILGAATLKLSAGDLKALTEASAVETVAA